MKPAQHVYSREFDKIFFSLQARLRAQIVARITEIGSRLDSFPHHRFTNRSEFRLRVGDWRVIYEFDLQRNIIYLITLGHRGKIYRRQSPTSHSLSRDVGCGLRGCHSNHPVYPTNPSRESFLRAAPALHRDPSLCAGFHDGAESA